MLDSNGGLDIDDNVGIGAHSQLWTHAEFGDIVEGCRFYTRKYMHVQKDVWFVGHCIVSPVRVGARSMALAGSVVTHEMLPNHVYGGVPARDLTEKLGPQFGQRSASEKHSRMQALVDRFVDEHPEHANRLVVVTSDEEIDEDDRTYFNVADRTYTRRRTDAEVAFLRAHVPLVKFVPRGDPAFVVPKTPDTGDE